MIKLDVEPYCHDCPDFSAEQHMTALGHKVKIIN